KQDFSERWNAFSRIFLSPKFSTTEGDPYPGEVGQMNKSTEVGMKFEQWRGEGGTLAHLGVELTYGTADNIHIFATGTFGQARGISGQMHFGDHASNRALDGFTTLATLGYSKTAKSSAEFLESSPKLWNNFQKSFSTTNKGATRTEASKAYREFIKNNNNSYFGNQIYTRFDN